MVTKVLATLLMLALLVGSAGCSKGDDGAPGTPDSGQSSGDAAFGKTSPPTGDSDFDQQQWDIQGNGEQPTQTHAPAPTFPTTPAAPTGENHAPAVTAITLDPSGTTVAKGNSVRISVTASDPDGDPLHYDWGATGGSFDSTEGFRAVWHAPDLTGTFVVTVTVTDGRGGTVSAQQSLTVIANNSPVVDSLTTSAASVGPGGSVIVTGVAHDPDGDSVSYKWTADGGVITGAGPNVTWVAPQVAPGGQETYTIKLTVDDGKGGVAIKTTTETIVFGYVTEVFKAIPAATGTVVLRGGSDVTRLVAGDNASNESLRAFWTFDLGKVKSSDIQSASLQFTYKQTVGDPFNTKLGIGGVRVWIVRYPPDKLPDYQQDPVQELTVQPLRESPASFDVTLYTRRIGQNMAIDDLVQLMVGFQRTTNNDGVEDSMEWSGATLTVTYAPV